MFELLLADRPSDDIVATAFGPVDGMPWIAATPPQDVKIAAAAVQAREVEKGHAAGKGSAIVENDVGAALERASRLAAERDALLVIAGSLYLVGDVLRLLRSKRGKIN